MIIRYVLATLAAATCLATVLGNPSLADETDPSVKTEKPDGSPDAKDETTSDVPINLPQTAKLHPVGSMGAWGIIYADNGVHEVFYCDREAEKCHFMDWQ